MLHFRHSPAMQKLRSRTDLSENWKQNQNKFKNLNQFQNFRIFQKIKKKTVWKSPKCRGRSISNRNEMDQLAYQTEADIKIFGLELRCGYLGAFAISKLHKRASNGHLSVKGAGLSLRLDWKFATGKNASHHVDKTIAFESPGWGRERAASGPRQGRICWPNPVRLTIIRQNVAFPIFASHAKIALTNRSFRKLKAESK